MGFKTTFLHLHVFLRPYTFAVITICGSDRTMFQRQWMCWEIFSLMFSVQGQINFYTYLARETESETCERLGGCCNTILRIEVRKARNQGSLPTSLLNVCTRHDANYLVCIVRSHLQLDRLVHIFRKLSMSSWQVYC